MARTTKAEVEGMFRRASDGAARSGVDTAGWTLVEGNITYGRAYRLYCTDPTTGGHLDVIGSDGYLGSTIREAYLTLHGMVRAFELVQS